MISGVEAVCSDEVNDHGERSLVHGDTMLILFLGMIVDEDKEC